MRMCDVNSKCMLSSFLVDPPLICMCVSVQKRQCSHDTGATLKLSRGASSHALSGKQACAPTHHVDSLKH